MTEKRFTVTFDDNIVDNLTMITHMVHSGYDVAMDLVGLLNELHEENKRLRRCINEIYTIARLEEVDRMTAKRFTLEWYAQKYQELSEENEQLREDIKEKEEVIKFYHRFNRGVDDDL